ncbi:MAG: GNAT family N-acetyltransferase [Actinobacteria bacterium]|nr:GNAT family N-acetyltransferase [Actinomycetota bacterium]MCA1720593.1 GNAT family N-acetyltransferase [Actinomycetota bacterium]
MPSLLPPLLAALPEEQPVLTVADLVLRPWEEADAPAVQAAYEDPEIQRWHGEMLEDAEAAVYAQSWAERWRTSSRAGWAVTRDDVLVGRITLVRLDLWQGQAEVTYWTVAAARGTGVAPRAVQAVATWAFGLGFHRLELGHSTANSASCRVAEKSGFRLECTRREQGMHADGWHDMHLHARLVGDPLPE